MSGAEGGRGDEKQAEDQECAREPRHGDDLRRSGTHRGRFRYWLSVGERQRPGLPTGLCLAVGRRVLPAEPLSSPKGREVARALTEGGAASTRTRAMRSMDADRDRNSHGSRGVDALRRLDVVAGAGGTASTRRPKRCEPRSSLGSFVAVFGCWGSAREPWRGPSRPALLRLLPSRSCSRPSGLGSSPCSPSARRCSVNRSDIREFGGALAIGAAVGVLGWAAPSGTATSARARRGLSSAASAIAALPYALRHLRLMGGLPTSVAAGIEWAWVRL